MGDDAEPGAYEEALDAKDRSRTSAPPRPSGRWSARLVAGIAVGLTVLLALPFAISTLVAEAFEIAGPSNEPTLLDGDRIVVSKERGAVFLPFQHEGWWVRGVPGVGDLVIAHSPSDNQDIAKRVIGLPGDRIEIRDDEVFRNGRSLARGEPTEVASVEGAMPPSGRVLLQREGVGDRTWLTSHSPRSIPDNFAEVRVPPGHVFLLGDHRDRSNDSRNPALGPVSVSRVKGVARLVYFSSSGAFPRWVE